MMEALAAGLMVTGISALAGYAWVAPRAFAKFALALQITSAVLFVLLITWALAADVAFSRLFDLIPSAEIKRAEAAISRIRPNTGLVVGGFWALNVYLVVLRHLPREDDEIAERSKDEAARHTKKDRFQAGGAAAVQPPANAEHHVDIIAPADSDLERSS